MQKIIRCVKPVKNDLFMMMHPTAVQVLKEITQTLYGSKETEPVDIDNWVSTVM